jgi:hypothetical protein
MATAASVKRVGGFCVEGNDVERAGNSVEQLEE